MTLTDFRPETSPSADSLSAFLQRPRTIVKVRITRAETPSWLPYVMGRLRDLEALLYEPDDETPTPYPEAIQRALPELARFMTIHSATPSVVPTVDGGVQFVWHKGGWDIEVEVGPKETLVWAQRRDGGSSWEGSLDDHVDALQELLSTVTSPA